MKRIVILLIIVCLFLASCSDLTVIDLGNHISITTPFDTYVEWRVRKAEEPESGVFNITRSGFGIDVKTEENTDYIIDVKLINERGGWSDSCSISVRTTTRRTHIILRRKDGRVIAEVKHND